MPVPLSGASSDPLRWATVTSVPPYRRSFVTIQPSGSAIGSDDSSTATSARSSLSRVGQPSKSYGGSHRARSKLGAVEQPTRQGGPDHGGRLVGQADGGQVAPAPPATAAEVLVDEGDRGRAPRERLDPEGAAPAEEVDHREPVDPALGPEDVEDRLAHPVRRGADRRRELGRQAPAPTPTSDDRTHRQAQRVTDRAQLLKQVLAASLLAQEQPDLVGAGAGVLFEPRVLARRWPRPPAGPRRGGAGRRGPTATPAAGRLRPSGGRRGWCPRRAGRRSTSASSKPSVLPLDRGRGAPGRPSSASMPPPSRKHQLGSVRPPDPAPAAGAAGRCRSDRRLSIDHDRGLGHVHPHLDHRGGHQHLDLAAAGSSAITSSWSAGVIWPCSRPTAQSGQLAGCRAGRAPRWPSGPRPAVGVARPAGRPRRPGGRPPPRRGPVPRPPARRPGAGAHVVVTGARPGGHLVEDGQVEVAEDHHGGGPRDRRGRHDQQVGVARRSALGPQGGPLLDPEAVLLVDHHHAERAGTAPPRSSRACVPTTRSTVTAGQVGQQPARSRPVSGW